MRHPLDVPEGTMFSNTLSAAKPNPEALRAAIARLQAMLEESRQQREERSGVFCRPR